VFITKLSLGDLRCFESAEISFAPTRTRASGTGNVTVLLGNNGFGKSTVLKAVALAALGPALQNSGFVPYRLVRRTTTRAARTATITGRFRLHWQDLGLPPRTATTRTLNLTTKVERRGDIEQVTSSRRTLPSLFEERSPALFIVGYGATRRVEQSGYDASSRAKQRMRRYERVAGLFEDGVTLIPLRAWLPDLKASNPGRFRQAVRLLDELLPEECTFGGRQVQRDYVFRVRGADVPFPALSDGYKAYIAWIGDLLFNICFGAPNGAKLTEFSGVVLVDEVDLHLHPEWQRTVVPKLSATLPKLQFIVTTHSPIVAGTLDSSRVVVLQEGADGSVTARTGPEPILGRNADQILVSSYFGLQTTRAQAAVTRLADLSRKARRGERDAALAVLETMASGIESQRPAARTRSARDTVPRS
jgi:predicted ATPase